MQIIQDDQPNEMEPEQLAKQLDDNDEDLDMKIAEEFEDGEQLYFQKRKEELVQNITQIAMYQFNADQDIQKQFIFSVKKALDSEHLVYKKLRKQTYAIKRKT